VVWSEVMFCDVCYTQVHDVAADVGVVLDAMVAGAGGGAGGSE
jgi:hypothetical protein